MERIARIAAAAIFVALIPLLLITSSVRFVINLPALYSYGFDRYNIAEYTRIERDDLIAAGRQFREYFNNDDEDLIIRTYVGGVLVESLYNAREIHHMRDVKALVRGVYLVQMLTLLYIAVYVAAGFALQRTEFWQPLGRDVSRGGKLTLVLVVVVGLLCACRVQSVVFAVPPHQFQQRLLDAGPAPRLPDSDVPARVLLRRDDVHRILHNRSGSRASRRAAHRAPRGARVSRARDNPFLKRLTCGNGVFRLFLSFRAQRDI